MNSVTSLGPFHTNVLPAEPPPRASYQSAWVPDNSAVLSVEATNELLRADEFANRSGLSGWAFHANEIDSDHESAQPGAGYSGRNSVSTGIRGWACPADRRRPAADRWGGWMGAAAGDVDAIGPN